MALFALVAPGGEIIQIEAETFPVAPPIVWTADLSAVTPAPQIGWTATEAAGDWNYEAPPSPPSPTLAQQAQAALSTGLAITSTGTPALNGVYAVDATTQARITSTMLYVQVNSAFPGPASTMAWPLMNGSTVTFPSTAAFQAFASAVANYVAALDEIARANTGALPVATATIA